MDIRHRRLHLITYDLGNTYMPDRFQPIKNQNHVKPSGGLWASPIRSKYSWADWCKAESFRELKTSFTFHYEGRVLRINRLQDALDMPWLCLYECVYYPDYESLQAMGIDAIWLTPKGEHETRYTQHKSLYGWDCESVLIMNPAGIKPD